MGRSRPLQGSTVVKKMHGTRGQGTSWPILGLCASFRARRRAICFTQPSKRGNYGSNRKLDAKQLV